MVRSRLVTLAVAACATLFLAPASAQSNTRQRLSKRMVEAFDHMEAGQRLLTEAQGLKGPEAEMKIRAAQARYGQAAAAYAEVLGALDQLKGISKDRLALTRRICHYNAACALSRQGKKKQALDAFGRALASGYDDYGRIEQDPDLDPIRKEDRFVQLLERVRAKLRKTAVAEGARALSKDALFAYDFSITTLDGKKLELADLKGKVVIVDYWGTWCPPCRTEVPHFVAIKKELGDRLAIVGMTYEGEEINPAKALAKVTTFAKKVGINYPLTLLVKAEHFKAMQKAIAVNGRLAFPTTLFIDKRGRVRAREVGYRDLSVIRALVTALDAEPGDEPAKKASPSEKKKPEKKKTQRFF